MDENAFNERKKDLQQILSDVEKLSNSSNIIELIRFANWIKRKLELQMNSQLNSVQKMVCHRGEIFWAVFGQNIGSEQNLRRPVIILQNNRGNIFGPTTIVAPITDSDNKKRLPVETPIKIIDPVNKVNLVYGLIKLQQIRVISKARLEDKICDLNDKNLLKENPHIPDLVSAINRACKISLGL